MDEWAELGERVVNLTERLAAVPSVVDTDGEARAADLMADYLRMQATGMDEVELRVVEVPKATACRAVLAYLPARAATARTLLLMGHLDTVGLEPYGALAEQAFDSEALKQAYAGHPEPAVAEAARSPDWLFGRGVHDMKGGIAALTEVFLREARRRALPANLILLLTTDEESASRGIRALIPELLRLKAAHSLEFTYVINADYTAPLTTDDTSRYFYSGVVGKLLVGLSIFGHPTHVGETFAGVNATALGGYLAHALEHNRRLLTGTGGEWLPPPTVLRLADRRERYDVMTADCAELYANVFHLGGDAGRAWRRIMGEVRRVLRRYDREQRLRYNRFVARANAWPPRHAARPEVIDYATLLKRAGQHAGDPTALVQDLTKEAAASHSDAREQVFHIVRGLHRSLPPGRPVVVVTLLPPYYPAFLAEREDPLAAKLIEACGSHGLRHRRVYPYISDMSYFAFGDSAELGAWQEQSPLWFSPEELQQYREAAAPTCNIGPWGCGAHTAEERVHLPFLRDELPRLLADALAALAAG